MRLIAGNDLLWAGVGIPGACTPSIAPLSFSCPGTMGGRVGGENWGLYVSSLSASTASRSLDVRGLSAPGMGIALVGVTSPETVSLRFLPLPGFLPWASVLAFPGFLPLPGFLPCARVFAMMCCGAGARAV